MPKGEDSGPGPGVALAVSEAKSRALAVTDVLAWHQRLGHPNDAALKRTLEHYSMKMVGKMGPCPACAFAKARTKAISKDAETQATQPGERLMLDISGPYPKTIVGSTYWLLIVDQYSSKVWSFFLKKKSELSTNVEFLIIKLQGMNKKPRFIRCDNA